MQETVDSYDYDANCRHWPDVVGRFPVGTLEFEVTDAFGILSTHASRHYPSLDVVTEYHAGMGHTDVMGTTVARGLRTLYGKH